MKISHQSTQDHAKLGKPSSARLDADVPPQSGDFERALARQKDERGAPPTSAQASKSSVGGEFRLRAHLTGADKSFASAPQTSSKPDQAGPTDSGVLALLQLANALDDASAILSKKATEEGGSPDQEDAAGQADQVKEAGTQADGGAAGLETLAVPLPQLGGAQHVKTQEPSAETSEAEATQSRQEPALLLIGTTGDPIVGAAPLPKLEGQGVPASPPQFTAPSADLAVKVTIVAATKQFSPVTASATGGAQEPNSGKATRQAKGDWFVAAPIQQNGTTHAPAAGVGPDAIDPAQSGHLGPVPDHDADDAPAHDQSAPKRELAQLQPGVTVSPGGDGTGAAAFAAVAAGARPDAAAPRSASQIGAPTLPASTVDAGQPTPPAMARSLTLDIEQPSSSGTLRVELHSRGAALDVKLTTSDQDMLGALDRSRLDLADAFRGDSYDLGSLVIQDAKSSPQDMSAGANGASTHGRGESHAGANRSSAHGNGGAQNSANQNPANRGDRQSARTPAKDSRPARQRGAPGGDLFV